jgi:L-ascorbate metabolism protein UlaG (beta-lactamase superfamily)
VTNSITWLGHSTVLIEMDGTRLLTDPVLRSRAGPLVRIAGPVAELSAPPDGVLISHLHADHADLPSLRRVAGAVPTIAPAGAARWLERHGCPDVREMKPGDVTGVGDLSIRALAALHDGRRRPLGGPDAGSLGYLVVGSASIYFAGDTDLFEAMAELRGNVDLALLPVWGWGSRVGPGHLDPQRAAEAAALIEPRVAIPIHWGTLALPHRRRARDPEAPARRFADLTRQNSPSVDVRVLQPGGITRIG